MYPFPMSQRLRRALGLTLVLAAFVSLRPQAQSPDRSNHVVIISLDGFKASALADPAQPLPNLRRLARAGAVARTMRPVNPTVTWANHTAMVTGVTPAKHHVVYNGLLVREPGMPPRVRDGPATPRPRPRPSRPGLQIPARPERRVRDGYYPIAISNA